MVKKSISKKSVLIYSAITALAVVTRFYSLGEGSILKDEMYTALYFGERVFAPAAGGLYYALVELSTEIFGISRWSLRLPSAILGVISIPVFYYITKRLMNPSAALVGSIFLIFNPWHLHYSQNARFYIGVFLFGLAAYFLFYLAIKRGSYTLLGASIFSNAVAFYFHPTSIFIAASCGLYSIFVVLAAKDGKNSLSKNAAKAYLILSVVACLVISPILYKTISAWIEIHPEILSRSFELSVSNILDNYVFESIRLCYRIFDNVELTVSFASLVGVWFIFKRNFSKGIFFATSIAVPIAILVVLSNLIPPVRPRYVYHIVPVLIASSALLASEWSRSAAYDKLTRVALPAILVVAMIPGFVSHYTVRSSLHVEDALNVIEEEYRSDDMVVVHERDAIYKIRTDHPEWTLEKSWGEDWKQTAKRASKEGRRVWFITNSSCVPGVLDDLESWLIDHASLEWRGDRKGFVHGLTGYEVWVMEGK